MSKLKVVWLIILVVVLVDFAVENAQPALAIKLFKFHLGELPQFLLVYLSLALGLAVGWLAHGLRIRRKRRAAQAAQAASAQQQHQEPQEG
ncbi:MAG: hypothetical protein A2139_06505 [Desulfobacca sp. RBG_16_60_12]|nr:MAG: hypothetical protein A2139_06505 [Desulfobacca sp. RBG_16_60_12]